MKLKQFKIYMLSAACLLTTAFGLQAQSDNTPAEKAFIHTDQPYYLSGQTIQFKAYLAPYSGSTVLHIGLWNEDLEVLTDQRIELKEGTANGQLTLDEDLPTGRYLLVAHTNWMLNFPGKYYGKKAFYLVNPEDPFPSVNTEELTAAFHPEGGHLIADRTNKIAFHFSDIKNELDGVIVNQNGDTVSRFKSGAQGYGLTNLLARAGANYSALISHEGSDYRFPIGSPKADQSAIRLVGMNSDTLSVLVNVGESFSDRSLTLQVRNQGKIILAAPQLVSKPAIKFTVPKFLLGNGLNQMVVLNTKDEIVSERLVYNQVRASLGANIKPEDSQLKSRSKVRIPVSLAAMDGKKSSAKLSVSIRNTQYFPQQSLEKTQHVQMLSELGINVPGTDFTTALADARFMDMVMLTQSVEAAKSAPVDQYYGMEGEQLIPISGKVSFDGRPMADSTVYLSILSEKPQFHTAKTGTDGSFNLLVYPFDGEADLILKLAQADESNNDLEYELFTPRPQVSAADFAMSYQPEAQLVRQHVKLASDNQMIGRNYFPETPAAQMEKGELGAFFFNYNLELDYTTYITLNSFTEIKRELIEQISINRRTGALRVKRHEEKRDWYLKPYKKAPLMLIDGLPVFDENKVLDLSPARIKDIRVMNRQYVVGGVIFDGVIELTTTDGEYHIRENTNHQMVKLPGYNQIQANRTQSAEVLESGRLPDFRSVLYWNPNLEAMTGETVMLEFMTSDDVGEFLLEIVGMDALGNPIHFEQIITVK